MQVVHPICCGIDGHAAPVRGSGIRLQEIRSHLGLRFFLSDLSTPSLGPTQYNPLRLHPQGGGASGKRPKSVWRPVWRPFDGTWGVQSDRWGITLPIETPPT